LDNVLGAFPQPYVYTTDYDAAGRFVEYLDQMICGTTAWQYDKRGRVTGEMRTVNGGR